MGFFPLPGSPAQPLPAPPPFIPQVPTGTYIIDCLNSFTYVWLWNGESFWFFPTRVAYEGASGYRWNGLFWFYDVIDPALIRAVSCPPTPTLY
ncbi:hypothetical protein J31TS4_17970 [Paenibacillus sp. J31TS4]|nr:hypothetical protein J31TS4_17970 [Paenibacillus sp. J31TS4]